MASAVVSVGMLSGCNEQKGATNQQYQPPQPNVRVTHYAARTGMEGLEYVLYIDVVVRNYGGSGMRRVWAEVNQDNNHYERHQDIYVSAGESESFTFRFNEASFWSLGSMSYRVWTEND